MSIFKDSFPDFVKTELTKRQTNIKNHDLPTISTLTNRNAWVRMVSGVEVNDDNGTTAINGTLFGGDTSKIPNQLSILSGYTKGARGIRPVPGITGIDVDSVSANGSLRKITVSFNCWDVNQLNYLEQLYMRPGYTVCIEWGWSHQLGDNKVLTPQGFFCDKILNINNDPNLKGKSLLELYRAAYQYSITYKGNYDVCLGKVSNYHWELREDGGYDCTTTIITYGEILDSLKVNFIALSDINVMGLGLIAPSGSTGFEPGEGPRPYYEKSLLSGLLYEIKMYSERQSLSDGKIVFISSDKFSTNTQNFLNPNNQTLVDMTNSVGFNPQLASKYGVTVNSGSIGYSVFTTSKIPNADEYSDYDLSLRNAPRSYILLSDFCRLISDFIIPQGENGKITEITTKPIDINPQTTIEPSIKINAYPIQLPMDLNVCLFYPKIWMEGVLSVNISNTGSSNQPSGPSIVNPSNYQSQINFLNTALIQNNFQVAYQTAYENTTSMQGSSNINLPGTPTTVYNYKSQNEIDSFNTKLRSLIELSTSNITPFSNFSQNVPIFGSFANSNQNQNNYVLTLNIPGLQNVYLIMDQNKNILFNGLISSLPDISDQNRAQSILNITISGNTSYWNQLWNNAQNNNISNQLNQTSQIIKNIFTPIKDPKYTFFTDDTYSSAYVGNIFVNIDFILKLIDNASSSSTSGDPNRKNELFFSTLFNSLLSSIQNSIGSINDLRVHVDPIDNKARIVDMDYVNQNTTNLFEFKIQNTSSITRNLRLESMIFPEQSTIMAISAQTKSGALGYGNQHLVAYNQGIVDRVVEGLDVTAVTKESTNTQQIQLINMLDTIASYYKSISIPSENKNKENVQPQQ
jgi:hypothetical protein